MNILDSLLTGRRRVGTHVPSVAALAFVCVAGCATAAQMHRTSSSTVLQARPDSSSLTSAALDSVCRLQSGLMFHLQVMPPWKYAKRAIDARLGMGTDAKFISGEVLGILSMGNAALPNGGIYPVGSSGILPVEVDVVDTLARFPYYPPQTAVHFELPLHPRQLWHVSILIGPTRLGNEEWSKRRPGPDRLKIVALPGGDSLYVEVSSFPQTAGPIIYGLRH